MGIVEQYLLQLKKEKHRWWCAATILAVLSLLVAIGVSWNLRMTGIAIANGATCGQEEHRHTEACYQWNNPCGYEEHIHDFSCYADITADVESAAVWEATLPELTGNWAEDLALMARSQLGCKESTLNYLLADDGQTKKGITRYGQWYGNPYGDWSSMFIMFCLNYAEVPQQAVPQSPGVYNMMRLAQKTGLLSMQDENIGSVGDIVFLDTDENGNADRALVVVDNTGNRLSAIGGDIGDSVREVVLSANDTAIMGYINMQAVQNDFLAGNSTKSEMQFAASGINNPEEYLETVPLKMMSSASRAAAGSIDSYLTTTADNLWQIVAGGYKGRAVTNKQDYGNVRIQKNIVPTDTENEFLVYLSIDKKMSWNTVFEYGTYYALSSNHDVGKLVGTGSGNPSELSAIQTGRKNIPFYMVIQILDDETSRVLTETETIVRYTDKSMKNGCITIRLENTNQSLVVAKVSNYSGSRPDNPVYVQLPESLFEGGFGGIFENFSVVDTVLDTVVDTMGDHIEFVGVVAGDYEYTPTYSNGTLTWQPKTAQIEAGQGSGQAWQENAAQLIYKIRLRNDKSCAQCLDTGCSVGCEHVYPTNKSANLTYHMSDAPGTTNRVEFQIPYVRGLLYDIHFTKIDQDSEAPIKGAVFQLTGKDDPSFPTRTAVSGGDGTAGDISFTDLPAGKYTLTETAAPDGYEITFGDARHSMDIVLSYAAAPESVMEDIYDASHNENLMYKGASDGKWKVSNKCTEVPVILPSTGGSGIALHMLCGLPLVFAPFVYGLNLRRKYAKRSREASP